MYKYLLCILLGILLFILLNNINGFSIGIPGGPGEPCRDDYQSGLDQTQCDFGICIEGMCPIAGGGVMPSPEVDPDDAEVDPAEQINLMMEFLDLWEIPDLQWCATTTDDDDDDPMLIGGSWLYDVMYKFFGFDVERDAILQRTIFLDLDTDDCLEFMMALLKIRSTSHEWREQFDEMLARVGIDTIGRKFKECDYTKMLITGEAHSVIVGKSMSITTIDRELNRLLRDVNPFNDRALNIQNVARVPNIMTVSAPESSVFFHPIFIKVPFFKASEEEPDMIMMLVDEALHPNYRNNMKNFVVEYNCRILTDANRVNELVNTHPADGNGYPRELFPDDKIFQMELEDGMWVDIFILQKRIGPYSTSQGENMADPATLLEWTTNSIYTEYLDPHFSILTVNVIPPVFDMAQHPDMSLNSLCIGEVVGVNRKYFERDMAIPLDDTRFSDELLLDDDTLGKLLRTTYDEFSRFAYGENGDPTQMNLHNFTIQIYFDQIFLRYVLGLDYTNALDVGNVNNDDKNIFEGLKIWTSINEYNFSPPGTLLDEQYPGHYGYIEDDPDDIDSDQEEDEPQDP